MLKPNTYYMSAYSETMKIQINVTAIIHETGKTIQQSTFFHFSSVFTPRLMRDWKNWCLGAEIFFSAPRHGKIVPRPGKV